MSITAKRSPARAASSAAMWRPLPADRGGAAGLVRRSARARRKPAASGGTGDASASLTAPLVQQYAGRSASRRRSRLRSQSRGAVEAPQPGIGVIGAAVAHRGASAGEQLQGIHRRITEVRDGLVAGAQRRRDRALAAGRIPQRAPYPLASLAAPAWSVAGAKSVSVAGSSIPTTSEARVVWSAERRGHV